MTSAIVPNIINEMCSFHEGTQAKRVSTETLHGNFNFIYFQLGFILKVYFVVRL